MEYGYQDSNELAPGKQGGKFGLNTGVNVIKFEYNPNAGASGAAQDGLDFTVQVEEKEYRHRFFPITKAWDKNGNEITDTNSVEYKVSIEKQTSQLNATLSDIVKCFVDEEVLKQSLSVPIKSFKIYAEILQGLVQSTSDWKKIPVDVFLHYQWKITGDNNKTFLELPKNVNQGLFICKSLGEGFKENRTATNLKYIDAQGLIHPIKRREWFLNSPNASQIDISDETFAKSDMSTSEGSSWL